MVLLDENLTCLLFDLDGTLVKYDQSEFLENYVRMIVPYFYANEMALITEAHVKEIRRCLRAGINYVSDEDGNENKEKTLILEKFLTCFIKESRRTKKEIVDIFTKFYLDDFDNLKNCIHNLDCAIPKKLISLCRKKGFKVVLATNPVFPKSVILHRMKWIGLSENDFDIITHAENCYHAKPSSNYYLDILKKTGSSPENTLMIGNDYLFDIFGASQIGIKTWLVDEPKYIYNKQLMGKCAANYDGDMDDLIQALENIKHEINH